MSHVLKIFGERNTGTRALSEMVAHLPGVRRRLGLPPVMSDREAEVAAVIDAGLTGAWRRHYRNALMDGVEACSADDLWKHAVPRLTPGMVGAGVATLCMVRNPYSWVLSLWKRPYHRVGPKTQCFETFLSLPWMTQRREGAPAVLASPIDLWSLKTGAVQSYQVAAFVNGLGCQVLRFEDFVQDARGVLEPALRAMGLPTEGLRDVTGNTKTGGLPVDRLRQRYAREEWRAELTPSAVKLINARLDWDVASAFGYARIEEEDVAANSSASPLAAVGQMQLQFPDPADLATALTQVSCANR